MRPCLTLLFVLLLATPIHAQPPGAWQDATPMSLSLSGSPTIGSANAKVTIVKSMSYQCPYCARLAPTLSSVKARFGDDVRLVIKHNPLGFHQRALPAAKAAMAAHLQGKFWAYHDLLLSNQKTLEDDDLERFARSIGLDMHRWRADKESTAVEVKILHDQASMIGHAARGTPASFINGKLVTGAKPLEAFEDEVQAALAEANAALRSGARPEALHATLAKRHGGQSYVDVVIYGGKPPAPPAPAPRRAPSDPNAHFDIPIHRDDPALGPKNAPVTLVVFTSLECGYSKRLVQTLPQLLNAYTGQLRLVFKQRPLPFHKQSREAAIATLAANAQGMFWPYQELVLENQRDLTTQNLRGYAEEVGLNLKAYDRFVKGRKGKAHLKRDEATAEKVGARGTPTSYVNGKQIRGAQPIEVFKEAIEAALKSAKRR